MDKQILLRGVQVYRPGRSDSVSPDVEVFEGVVTNHLLQGVLQKGQYSSDITITNAPGALLEFIDQPRDQRLFNYTEPMILRKIAGPEHSSR